MVGGLWAIANVFIRRAGFQGSTTDPNQFTTAEVGG
jgi:hypothetical protein